MKKITLALLASIIYLTSCNPARMATSNNNDDVYYSDRDARTEKDFSQQISSSHEQPTPSQEYTGTQQGDNQNSSNQSTNEDYTVTNNQSSGNNSNETPERFQDNTQSTGNANSTQSSDQNGNTYVTNNYYNNDDYYDYAYSSRIRHFYHPYGWNYYDPYYTNMYWYNYDPYSYGVSLYLSYSWWGAQNNCGSNWGISNNYGYPYYGGYGGSYNGGYGGGYYGGYGYNNGYANGYMNGYYAGLYNGSFNPYYFNSNDPYSYYYGPRGGRGAIANNAPREGRNLSELFERQEVSANPRNPKLTAISESGRAFGKPKREISALNENVKGVTGKYNNSNIKESTLTQQENLNGTPKNNIEHQTIKPSSSEIKYEGNGATKPTKEAIKSSTLENENNGFPNPKNNGLGNPKDYSSTPKNQQPIKETPENKNWESNPSNQNTNPRENSSPRNVQSTPRYYSAPTTTPREVRPQNSGKPRSENQPPSENSTPKKNHEINLFNNVSNAMRSGSNQQNNDSRRNNENQSRPTNTSSERQPSNSNSQGRSRNR